MKTRLIVILTGLCVCCLQLAAADVDGYELSHGRQVLLSHGLQIQAFAYPWPVVPLNPDVFRASNFTTVALSHADAGVAAALAPEWSKWTTYNPETQELYDYCKQLTPAEMQIVDRFVGLKYGDEVPDLFTNPVVIPKMAAQFAEWNRLYPNALAYTNHYGSFMDENQLRGFMRAAQPDMLMFDTYPGDFGNTRETWFADMAKYRKVALEGYDGSGKSPLPYGQYLKLYTRESNDRRLHSESFVRVQQFASWALGYTFTDGLMYGPFREDIQTDVLPQMFSGRGDDSAPTAVFGYVAETNRQSRHLGPALVRLVSTDVRVIPATYGTHQETYWDLQYPYQHSRTVDDNLSPPEGIAEWSRGAGGDSYITAITPLGNDNGASHIHGDVLIGYFQPLVESNPRCTFVDGLHFMIVNGRGTSESEWWDSASTTAASLGEWFRLAFDFTGSNFNSLVRLSRDTGQVELVSLTSLGSSRYALDLYLDGGTGDLFGFWNSSNPLPTVPEPGSLLLLTTGMIGLLVYTWRKRR